MAYTFTTEGHFTYANAQALEAALDQLDGDDSLFEPANLKRDGLRLLFDRYGWIPAELYWPTLAALEEVGKLACFGRVTFQYEEAPLRSLSHGGFTDTSKLSPRHYNWELLEAFESGDLEAIDALVEQGAQLSFVEEKREQTLLHAAARSGNAQLVRRYCPPNGSVWPKTKDNSTPLHMATSAEVIDVLLEHGANLHIKTSHGKTPLDCVCEQGLEEAAIALIKAGAFEGDEPTVQLPQFAGAFGMQKVLTLALERVSTERPLELSNSLYFALDKGHLKFAERLFSLGFFPKKNHEIGAFWGSATSELVKMRLEHDFEFRALLQKAGNYGAPIVDAAAKGNLALVQLLHENYNAPVEPTKPGLSPIHAATLNHHHEVMRYLLKQGANPRFTTHDGQTPEDFIRDHVAQNAATLKVLYASY